MHKTIYIDIDEEITGIIDRIRKEGAPDIFIVVPKNAMLTQGLLNLKLLKKEAGRLNKNVMLVTNDKYAKKVIEKAGLETRDKALSDPEDESRIRRAAVYESSLPDKASEKVLEEMKKIEQERKEEREIGSNSFYVGTNGDAVLEEEEQLLTQLPRENLRKEQQQGPPEKTPQDLKRELYAEPPTAAAGPQKTLAKLESPIFLPPASQAKPPIDIAPRRIDLHKQSQIVTPPPRLAKSPEQVHLGVKNRTTEKDKSVHISQGLESERDFNVKKAEEFFSSSADPVWDTQGKREEQEPVSYMPKNRSKRVINWRRLIFWPSAIVAALVVIAWVYWNYPKVSIAIYPQQKSSNVVLDVVASESGLGVDFGQQAIAVKIEEFELSKTVEHEATGEKYASDSGRAKGAVTISNNYSTSPQPLVATTRILSKEGKLFRLVDSVTVPGMKGDTAGTVEAEVIADKPGEDYNIGSSTFTIEGFKGGPKYEKFEVASASAMTGGGQPQDSKMLKVVTAKDLEEARQVTMDEFDKSMEQELSVKVEPARKILSDTVKKEIVKSTSSKKEGDTADTFSHTIVEKVIVASFLESDIYKLALEKIDLGKDSGYKVSSVMKPEYKKAVFDFEKKKLTLQVSYQFTLRSIIDAENIRKGIIGKSEQEMKAFLAGYSELEKAEIKFSPSWLGKVPVAESKVNVVIAE